MARGNSKPSNVKTKNANVNQAQQRTKHAERGDSTLPLAIQQKCLDLFRNSLKPQDQPNATVQEVKGHLYNRDFAQAFGRQEYLQVYAARWSPSRALGYLQILSDVSEHIFGSDKSEDDDFKICCIGGGAGAEMVAIAAWISQQEDGPPFKQLQSTFLDIAAWGQIAFTLYETVSTPPELSKYASAAAKEANKTLVDPKIYTTSFLETDALNMDEEASQNVFEDVDLVTLMFTLNELYSTSIPKTQQLLARLTETLRPGSHLLVVDSPGSYSAVSLNGAEKKYPMQWLLDYTLIGTGQKQKENVVAKWEKLISDDSKWFRLPQGLQYPIELENMRYQMHLYRRLDDGA